MDFIGANFPALEQLGIYKELKKVSKPYSEVKLYDVDLKKLGSFKMENSHDAYGYEGLLFCRSKFCEVLRNCVPEHMIGLKKKVLRTEENDCKVHIRCSDSTSYTGDILVGADGTYS